MRFSFELSCQSMDQNEVFFKCEILDSVEHRNEFTISARTFDSLPEEECFEMICTDRGESIKIETTINHGGKKYSQKGLPEAMIIKIAELFRKNIKSSSNKDQTGPDSLNPLGEKYWKRLMALKPNNVDYLEDEGRYLFICKDEGGE